METPRAIIENVSDTAFWIAGHRATESRREDALFKDPLAARLAGVRGQQIAEDMPLSRMTAWTVVMRTRIIDDLILAAIAEGVDTVINLGAGLDTRPYRLALPASVRWIEVDFPAVIDFKNAQLQSEAPRCRLERVSLDLSDLAARKKKFSEWATESSRILILTEGVVPYLSNEDVGLLGDDLKEQKSFCYWIVDYFSPRVTAHQKRFRRRMKNAPFLFHPLDWFGFFKKHGWVPREIRYLGEEGERLSRSMPMAQWMRRAIRALNTIIPQRYRNLHHRFAAYVLLERS